MLGFLAGHSNHWSINDSNFATLGIFGCVLFFCSLCWSYPVSLFSMQNSRVRAEAVKERERELYIYKSMRKHTSVAIADSDKQAWSSGLGARMEILSYWIWGHYWRHEFGFDGRYDVQHKRAGVCDSMKLRYWFYGVLWRLERHWEMQHMPSPTQSIWMRVYQSKGPD